MLEQPRRSKSSNTTANLYQHGYQEGQGGLQATRYSRNLGKERMMTLVIVSLLVAILSFLLVIRAVWRLVAIIKHAMAESRSFREREKTIIEAAKLKYRR